MKILRNFRRRLLQSRGSKGAENPSIVDFPDEQRLAIAMGAKKPRQNSLLSVSASESGSSFGGGQFDNDASSSFVGAEVEWTLPLVDKEVTIPQTMEEEMKRLKALNDYFVLDSQGEVEFDRLTVLASQIFQVPTALVSLVDLGRQWFLSKVGLDASETPRKHAFCAHVILNKYKLLVVPDATQDFRFKDNPLVTAGLKIRFYAGAALVSPEGYKLGTLCIIDYKPRPEGLSPEQQGMLHEMAAMVVSAMVARRNRILKEEYEARFVELASTLRDTHHQLETARMTLSNMLSDKTWEMDSEHAVELASISRTLGVQSNICAATRRKVLQDTDMAVLATKEPLHDEDGFESPVVHDYEKMAHPTTDMEKLFESVNRVLPTFPFHGTVSIEFEKSVPREIIAEDLLLFRSVLNMLTHCMGGSGPNVEPNQSGLRIRRMKRHGNELLVQCCKAGPPISAETAKELFNHKESLLGPVASMVRSLGGRYGMFEGKWDHQGGASGAIQSIFWFQFPYELPEDLDPSQNKLTKTLRQDHHATEESMEKNTNEKIKLDPFQAALMEAGCGGRGRK